MSVGSSSPVPVLLTRRETGHMRRQSSAYARGEETGYPLVAGSMLSLGRKLREQVRSVAGDNAAQLVADGAYLVKSELKLKATSPLCRRVAHCLRQVEDIVAPEERLGNIT